MNQWPIYLLVESCKNTTKSNANFTTELWNVDIYYEIHLNT